MSVDEVTLVCVGVILVERVIRFVDFALDRVFPKRVCVCAPLPGIYCVHGKRGGQ